MSVRTVSRWVEMRWLFSMMRPTRGGGGITLGQNAISGGVAGLQQDWAEPVDQGLQGFGENRQLLVLVIECLLGGASILHCHLGLHRSIVVVHGRSPWLASGLTP
jgi:hypothetical protein